MKFLKGERDAKYNDQKVSFCNWMNGDAVPKDEKPRKKQLL